MPKSFTMHDAHQSHSKHGCKLEDANYKNKTLKNIEKNVLSFATNLDQVHGKNTNVQCTYNDGKIFAMPTIGDCPH